MPERDNEMESAMAVDGNITLSESDYTTAIKSSNESRGKRQQQVK